MDASRSLTNAMRTVAALEEERAREEGVRRVAKQTLSSQRLLLQNMRARLERAHALTLRRREAARRIDSERKEKHERVARVRSHVALRSGVRETKLHLEHLAHSGERARSRNRSWVGGVIAVELAAMLVLFGVSHRSELDHARLEVEHAVSHATLERHRTEVAELRLDIDRQRSPVALSNPLPEEIVAAEGPEESTPDESTPAEARQPTKPKPTQRSRSRDRKPEPSSRTSPSTNHRIELGGGADPLSGLR